MNIITILIGLFICHWLADYTHLSTSWMLNAKRLGKPIFPIFIHACVHGSLMGIFLLFFVNIQIILLVISIQIVSHFLIDLWKGKMNSWLPLLQSPMNKFHWYIFGFDQLLHTIIILTMASILIK